MSILLLPSPFKLVRQHNEAPFQDMVFATNAERNAFLTSPRRYAGMVVADLEDSALYFLNAAKTAWVSIGTATYTYYSRKFIVGTTSGAPTDDTTVWNLPALIDATDFEHMIINNAIETREVEFDVDFESGDLTRGAKFYTGDIIIVSFNKKL